MLEPMAQFFENRIEDYEEHMLLGIDSAWMFYPYTAAKLPQFAGAKVLDLGCGTGLELDYYFKINPEAKITGIDLSSKMLDKLRSKFEDKEIELICGSYFDVSFGKNCFDAAVSVESLHHFTMEEKIPLYTKLCSSLKDKGHFVLTDYFAMSNGEEKAFRDELLSLKAKEGIGDELVHFDTPLTVEHEIEALIEAGFSSVEVSKSWGATHTIIALSR